MIECLVIERRVELDVETPKKNECLVIVFSAFDDPIAKSSLPSAFLFSSLVSVCLHRPPPFLLSSTMEISSTVV